MRSLSKAELDDIIRHVELVELKLGETIYEMEDAAKWVYCPEVGLLSLITVMESGAAIETSIVGKESAVGFMEALGSGVMHTRVIVQIPGRAYRLRAAAFRDAFDSSPSMRAAVHRQAELLLAVSRQAIACHGLHPIKQRFNRWILECQDLSGLPDEMPLKQEFLAVMLGVSRTAVTRIAVAAQDAGLIRYSRGRVTVLDPQGLEDGACECRRSVQHLRGELGQESRLAREGREAGDSLS